VQVLVRNYAGLAYTEDHDDQSLDDSPECVNVQGLVAYLNFILARVGAKGSKVGRHTDTRIQCRCIRSSGATS
jgi:hypothetical protein